MDLSSQNHRQRKTRKQYEKKGIVKDKPYIQYGNIGYQTMDHIFSHFFPFNLDKVIVITSYISFYQRNQIYQYVIMLLQNCVLERYI